MELQFIIKFLFLTFFVSGVIIFFLHRALISGVDSAVKRLDAEIAKTNKKQLDLNRKLREADEELEKRRTEAKALADKMRTDAEEGSKAEREKIISAARAEGEEIIEKAQMARARIRIELQKEMDLKIVDFGMQVLNEILSEKAKGALEQILIGEFLENLKNIDMSKISPSVNEAEVVTANHIEDSVKNQFQQVIKDKLNRDISINVKIDAEIGGGVILKFGSLALDGSIRNLIRESGISKRAELEAENV